VLVKGDKFGFEENGEQHRGYGAVCEQGGGDAESSSLMLFLHLGCHRKESVLVFCYDF
jgi:hypothetical protein